jgi:hypothetical protein
VSTQVQEAMARIERTAYSHKNNSPSFCFSVVKLVPTLSLSLICAVFSCLALRPSQQPTRHRLVLMLNAALQLEGEPAKAAGLVTAVPSRSSCNSRNSKSLLIPCRYNWCGSTSAYCGKGCNPLYGTCSSAASTLLTIARSSAAPSQASLAAAPAASVMVSRNARCGNTQGATGGFSCLGSKWGDCCSR